MYVNLSSDSMSVLELTDYAERVLVERLGVVPGVARIRINGARRYAMRVWLDREALAARQLTVTDIENALRRENVQLPAGRLESSQRELTLRTETGLNTEQDFRNLVVGRGPDGYLVRLGEVADVRLAAENERSISRSNGVSGISIGVEQISKANTLEVAREVRAELDRLRPELPPGTALDVNIDRAVFIEESMKEVVISLVIAVSLVLAVIYLFLGNVRATLIPAVTIPVSIIAAFIVMAALGFSINMLTLLGLVLAIGLVVDDSIIVLENIYRRMEGGEPPLLAAVDGSREIGFAVIATTLVLIAVFVPISFLQGNVGLLFREFGFTVAAAIAFSSLVALTLTPMMSSKLLVGRRDALALHAGGGQFLPQARGCIRGRAAPRDAPPVARRRRHAGGRGGRGAAAARAAERAHAGRGPGHGRLHAGRPRGRDARVHGPPCADGRGHRGARGRDRRGRARHQSHTGRLRRGHGAEPGARRVGAGTVGRARAQRRADRAVAARRAEPDPRRALRGHGDGRLVARRRRRRGAGAGRARRYRLRRTRRSGATS